MNIYKFGMDFVANERYTLLLELVFAVQNGLYQRAKFKANQLLKHLIFSLQLVWRYEFIDIHLLLNFSKTSRYVFRSIYNYQIILFIIVLHDILKRDYRKSIVAWRIRLFQTLFHQVILHKGKYPC